MSRAPERRLQAVPAATLVCSTGPEEPLAETQGVDDIADQHDVLGIDPFRNSDSFAYRARL